MWKIQSKSTLLVVLIVILVMKYQCQESDEHFRNVNVLNYETYTYDSSSTPLLSNNAQEPIKVQVDPLCTQWKQKLCVECASRSFMYNGKCKQVSNLCNAYNSRNGDCTSCFRGYQIHVGSCIISRVDINSNPLCTQWEGNVCLRCSRNSFLNQKGICQQINPFCRTYSERNGQCLSCFEGYALQSGNCLKEINTKKDDNPLCQKWQNDICTACSFRSYKDSLDICKKVSPMCNTYSISNGECTSCYQGYDLQTGKCLAKSSIQDNKDPLCSEWQNSQCEKCVHRAYLSENGICNKIDDQCKSFSYEQKKCVQCYLGYTFDKSNRCIIQNQKPVVNLALNNPYCAEFSTNGQCLRCSVDSYMLENRCVLIDPNCKTFNRTYKLCQQCYLGYNLFNSQCIMNANQRQLKNPSEVKIPPTFINSNQKISLYSIGCSRLENNKCALCNQGYELSGGICIRLVFSEKIIGSDYKSDKQSNFCLKWKNNKCLECIQNYSNNNGKCCCSS